MSPASPPELLRGARRPQREVRPVGIVGSYGDLAVELVARAGVVLDPWQVDGQDLMLSVDRSGLWACPDYCELVARQNGKTAALLLPRALAAMFLLGEMTVAWTAHEVKTALEGQRAFTNALHVLGREVRENLWHIDDDVAGPGVWVKAVSVNGRQGFERLDTGQRVIFIARSAGSGRGFPITVLLLDEAYALTDEQSEALMPTVTAQANWQCVFVSTPPTSGSASEPLYRLRARAEALHADPTIDDYLGWRDWGPQGLWLADAVKLSLDRLYELAASANPSLGLRITWRTITMLRRKLRHLGWLRESLCIWPEQVRPADDAAIPAASWERAGISADVAAAVHVVDDLALGDDEEDLDFGDPGVEDPDAVLDDTLVGAIDCSPNGASTSIAIAGVRAADGVDQVELVHHQAGTAGVVAWILGRQQPHGIIRWGLYGAGPAGELVAPLEAAGVDLVVLTGQQMARACAGLHSAVGADPPTVRHLHQPALDNAREASRRRDAGADGAWTYARRGVVDDISPIVAVTVARHLLITGTEEEESWAFET